VPRILIADDSELSRKSLKNIFSRHNEWTLCGEAFDGHQAVLMAHELKPDLIILDVAMPMMDGLHAAIEILRAEPSVPIILYTLHNSAEIELGGKRIGARKVISKMDNSEVLVETIRELLEQTATVQEKTPAQTELPKLMLPDAELQSPVDPDGSPPAARATN